MNSLLKTYRFLICTPLKDKKKITYIVFLRIKVAIILNFVPLKNYVFMYFAQDNNQIVDLSNYSQDISLIKRVLKILPGKHTCLKESIVVHLYLRSKGVNAPIHLGVCTKNDIQAHAWYDGREENSFNQFFIRNGQDT